MRLSSGWPLAVASALLAVVPSLPGSASGMTASAAISTAAMLDIMKQMPRCGLACSLSEIPSRCDAITDAECICTNDALRLAMVECVQEKCTPVEAITVARLDAQMCGTGHRSREEDNIAALAVEVPAWITVGFRLWARWSALGRFEADDWAMVLGWPLYTVFLILGQYCNRLAFGRDIWDIPEERLTLALKIFFIDESFYIAVLMVTKLSVILFLLRIFPQRAFRTAAWAVFAFVLVSNVIFVFLQVFQCSPIDYNWKGWKGDFGPHRCIDVNMLSYTHSSFSIAHDVIILFLPMPLVWQLNMGWRQKAGIFIMFSLGVVIVATSCVRLQYIIHFARSTNPTWDYTDALIWSGVEVSVAVIVTSLPAISVFLTTRFPHLFGSRGSSNQSGGPSGSGGRGDGAAHIKTFGSAQQSGTNGSRSRSRVRAALSSGRGGGGGGGRRRNQNSVFSLFEGDDSSSQGNESQLELGERIKGEVQTDIACGSISPMDDSDGIAERDFELADRGSGDGGGEKAVVLDGARGRNGNADSGVVSDGSGSGQRRIHVRTTTVTRSSEWEPGMAFGVRGWRGSGERAPQR